MSYYLQDKVEKDYPYEINFKRAQNLSRQLYGTVQTSNWILVVVYLVWVTFNFETNKARGELSSKNETHEGSSKINRLECLFVAFGVFHNSLN